nr:SGNH/GDSL hydrolase family protein [Rhodococcus sp. (in: high G+C Gram-positive bacteria)]
MATSASYMYPTSDIAISKLVRDRNSMTAQALTERIGEPGTGGGSGSGPTPTVDNLSGAGGVGRDVMKAQTAAAARNSIGAVSTTQLDTKIDKTAAADTYATKAQNDAKLDKTTAASTYSTPASVDQKITAALPAIGDTMDEKIEAALSDLPTGGGSGTFTPDPVYPGLYLMGLPSGGGSNIDGPLALQSATYRAAAKNAGASRLKILTIGDSTTDGFGNPGGPDQWSKTWPVRIAELMRTELKLPAGGRGWVPCMTPLDPGSYVYRVSALGPAGRTAVDTLGSQIGIPGSMWLQRGHATNADEVTWNNLTGVTSAQVVTTGYGPAGSLIITPQSGAVRNLDSTGERVFTSIATPGASLKVNSSDGNGIAALGMVEYKGDETAGVTTYNLGQGSMAAHEYLFWMTQGGYSLKPMIGQIAPHVALVCLGANDFQRGRPLQTIVENLGGLRMEIQSASPNTEVVFVLRPVDPLATLEQAPAFTWDELCANVIAAAEGIGAPVLDLRGKVPASGTDLYINDRIHLTEAGNLAYASALRDFMKVAS